MDLRDELYGRESKVGADEIDQPGFAKFIAGSVIGFGDAVGIDDEEIAGRQRKFLRDAFPVGGHADNGGSGMEALDGAVASENEGGVVTTIGVFELASNIVVDCEEECGVAVVGGAVEEKLVDGVEEAREIVKRDGVAASEIGLEIGHQQSAGNSLPGNVGENEGESRRTEIEEVVVVPADLARLHAGSGVFERGQWRADLREKTELDVAGDVYFMSSAALGFHAVGDVLREANVFKGDGGLPGDGIEEALVFTRVRLFGKRLAKNQQTDEMSAMADQRHETFGRKRSERKLFRRIAGTGRGNVPSTAPSGEFDEKGRIRRKGGEFRRNRTAGGDERVIVSAEIEGQGLRMESLSEMAVQKRSEFVAVGDGARFVGEILEDQACIVGSAKEGAIDALRAALDDRTRRPNERHAEEALRAMPNCE